MLGAADKRHVAARMHLLATEPASRWHATGVYALVALVALLPVSVLGLTM